MNFTPKLSNKVLSTKTKPKCCVMFSASRIKRANDLMTHRRDVIVLHPTDTQEEVLRIIHEEHFSKYLLVESGKDEIVGVVSVKDIILMLGGEEPFNLRTIARPPLFIPESLYAKKSFRAL